MREQRDKQTQAPLARGSALVFLACLLALPPGVAGAVICICHDGHMAFETACEPANCCPDVESAADAGPKAPCKDPESHSCSDIPLPAHGQVFDAAKWKVSDSMKRAVAQAIPASRAAFVPASNELTAEPAAFTVRATPPHVRTVVIRI